jgi:hypothetical protein
MIANNNGVNTEFYPTKSVLVFSIKSRHKDPGLGVGEYLAPGDAFIELRKIKYWRRILGREYRSKLLIYGKLYNSQENYI